ncbi:myosin-binding protein 2 isoform X1 [Musa acuminata AAA Group]|uniref:myosin-binding protein 2 isoform X1 n=1 Tax=Musa acuminata AAA Group TaxID=214697 RepID=UPI0031D738B9
MAANKFATVLHRNSHRMALILAYAILEWALIILLLLNGFFAYLIARFADYFGLKPPCIFCSRVDHLFQSDEGRRRCALRDLICDEHAAEVAKLGYCSHHRRLAEAGEMCEDCSSSSRPVEVAVLSWMKRIEEGEKDLRCSCCDVVLESGFYSPYLLVRPSVGNVEYDQKGNLVNEFVVGDRKVLREDDALCQEKVESGELVSEDQADGRHEEEEEIGEKFGGMEAIGTIISEREVEEIETLIEFSDAGRLVEDASLELLIRYPENIHGEDRLVPVELIDSATMTNRHVAYASGKQDQGELGHAGEAIKVLDTGSIGEEREAVAFLGGGTDVFKVNSSGYGEMQQDDRPFDIGSIAEEEKELLSATEMADIVEVNSLRNDGVEQEVMVLDVGCIIEETTLASAVGSADVTKKNSSEDVSAEHQVVGLEYTICMSEEEKTLVSAGERADSEMEGGQQHAVTLDKRSISDEEITLTPFEESDDTIEENFSDVDRAQQNSMTLDLGIISAEEKVSSLHILEGDDILEQNSVVLSASEPTGECLSDHQVVASLATPIITLKDAVVIQVESLMGEEDLPRTHAYEEENKLIDVETNCEISIGSEICDQEYMDHAHLHEPILMSENTQDQQTESYNETTATDKEISVTETEAIMITVENPDHVDEVVSQENNEIEEERAPETPTSVDGIHGLHKRFLFGRRESGTESLDGSVASEFEGCETLAVDQLKAALKAERKALSALYAELEEERSAAAIAANQTMAMITRLQEEKAAMQMEALQYQRMMDEQSEYDQEALELLNELMIKREREKQDLEKELEVYRNKVLHYEAMERRRMTKHKINGKARTSASSSAEDSDDLSFEFQEGDEHTYSPDESNQNTPSDAVLISGTDQGTERHLITLEESLADFEEERRSILEQLRALESKLFTLDGEDSHDSKVIDHVSDQNGHVSNGHREPPGDDLHDYANGFSDELETNRKQPSERRNMGFKGKRLLPLFDAISNENEDDICTEEGAADASPETISNIAEEQKKLAIEEEVYNINERLHALEADREFLKNCIGSLKKGDKGIHLLQEILEHLRDLRDVELRAMNSYDALASLSA